MLLDERQEGGSEVRIEFHAAMREAFRAPIIGMMGRFAHLSLPRAREILWRVLEYDDFKAGDVDALPEPVARICASLTR